MNDGTIYVTVAALIELREYRDRTNRSPFRKWFDGLNRDAAVKVTTALRRVELGNMSNVRGVGAGVFEYKIHFGNGYRIYFGKQGEEIVILLGVGTKKSQDSDIRAARERWEEYRRSENAPD